NGAGKSTLVKILATVLLPDSGTARILGHDIVEERREVRRLIGVMLSVERGFFLKLTGRENLKYFGMLYGLSGSALEKRVQEVLREVGLLKNADKPFEEYSLGMKARLGIARALLNDPEVLILDEPTLGLDPVSARRVRALIRSLAKEGGKDRADHNAQHVRSGDRLRPRSYPERWKNRRDRHGGGSEEESRRHSVSGGQSILRA
ncbi:MAG: ABC transporter ATP-binding protein, partial [Thermofilum sp.]